jgi:hypothetical protein
MPLGNLEAGGLGGGDQLSGGATDAGVIRSPGSCSLSDPSLETGGISGGSGVAEGVVAAGVVSFGGACAITRPAASMDKAVEIAEVPSSRLKRRELDMIDPKMPDLDQLLDPRIEIAPMRKPITGKP